MIGAHAVCGRPAVAAKVVDVEKDVITIAPAVPQVIYVPQYNPTTVVVYSSLPVYGYYPAPYPVYYYLYPPGAAFATGLIWGATIGAAWHGGYWGCNWRGGSINNNINRGNVNFNTGNINRGNVNRGGASTLPAGGTAWKPNKQPGQVASAAGRPTSYQCVADARPSGTTGGAGARPSTQPGGGNAGMRPTATAKLAAAMTAYNPDASWKRVEG